MLRDIWGMYGTEVRLSIVFGLRENQNQMEKACPDPVQQGKDVNNFVRSLREVVMKPVERREPSSLTAGNSMLVPTLLNVSEYL